MQSLKGGLHFGGSHMYFIYIKQSFLATQKIQGSFSKPAPSLHTHPTPSLRNKMMMMIIIKMNWSAISWVTLIAAVSSCLPISPLISSYYTHKGGGTHLNDIQVRGFCLKLCWIDPHVVVPFVTNVITYIVVLLVPTMSPIVHSISKFSMIFNSTH